MFGYTRADQAESILRPQSGFCFSGSRNPGEGVLTPDVYDPTLNRLYRDVLAHYGAVALPRRVCEPDSTPWRSSWTKGAPKTNWCSTSASLAVS